MIRIEEEKLIIEISHPVPEEFLSDLKKSIIESIQNQVDEPADVGEVHFANYILLELLKNLL